MFEIMSMAVTVAVTTISRVVFLSTHTLIAPRDSRIGSGLGSLLNDFTHKKCKIVVTSYCMGVMAPRTAGGALSDLLIMA